MRQELQIIHRAFQGKLVGTKRMQRYVCEVVSVMPVEVISFVTRNCWFLSSMDDAWGFAFRGNDVKNQYLIFLSDELFSQSKRQIRYSIAHEIGHVILKHRNSVLIKQSKQEIRKQEKEADAFAKTYLSTNF